MILVVFAAVSAGQVLKIILMVLAAIVALSVVVIIHELGHFISARRTGVKVEAFSVGFGPKIWGVRKGETEYRFSLLLFGGYVKMKGMESEGGKEPHEIEGGFFAARPGRRALIALSGPAMNIVLALGVFTLLWFTGRKVPQGVRTTTIGYVEEGSPARKAGLVPGDTIVGINQRKVLEWKDVMAAVAFAPVDSPIDLTVRQDGKEVEKRILVEWDKEAGFRHLRIYPRMDLLVAEVLKGSLAERLGLKKDDRLLSLGGQPLHHLSQFREILRKNIGKKIDLLVARETKGSRELSFSFTVPDPEDGILVEFVKKGSPAATAGLRVGDVVAAAAGQKTLTVAALEEILGKSAGEKVKLEVLRGKRAAVPGKPPATAGSLLLGAAVEEGFPVLGFAAGEVYGVKKEDPLSATYYAVKNVVLTLKGLVTRRVSTKGLSGPVGIVGLIAKSISISFTTFLYFIGFLSANFAVLNLLPIPIVDGGHIMFSGIEKVRGKPIRQKTMTALINTFFILIIAFFLFVTRNDIVKFFKGGSEEAKKKEVVLWLQVPETGVSGSAGEERETPSGE